MAVRGNRNVHHRNPDAGRREGIVVDYEDTSAMEAIDAYDAKTGEKLDSEEVRKGRAKEVRGLDEFEVKMEVDESEMRLTPGKKIWSKWVETRKDPNSSAIRCRLCATEVNTGESRSDTFAATPPLKFVRLILSWAASYKPKRANASIMIASVQARTLCGTLLRVMRDCGIADTRSARIAWTAARSILSV